MMQVSRANVISSFTIIKGSLIDETYDAFAAWNLSASKHDNLVAIKEKNVIAARSAHWLRDVAFVLSRRFDPTGRDRALIELAKSGCDREVWKPLLLWHMTRDEFLLRDFLVFWLYPRFSEGVFSLTHEEVVPYLERLTQQGRTSKPWTPRTLREVAQSLLRIAADFGLLEGQHRRQFASFHLPTASLMYLLHAMRETEPNPRKLIELDDWHLFLMNATDIERELLHLHQYRKVHYEVAGSLAQLTLPCVTAAEYAREYMS